MADLAARREARRRKILERSESRLKKITGVEQRSTKSELDGIVQNHTVEEPENVLNNLLQNHIPDGDVNTFSSVNNLSRSSEENNETGPTLYTEPERTLQTDSVSKPTILAHRVIYITGLALTLSFVLVVLDRNFYSWGIDSKSLYLNKIFVPLLCLEMYDMYYRNLNADAPDMFTSLLLISSNNRLNPRVVLFVTRYLRYLTQVVQDVAVYFFVFNASHYLFQMVFW